MTSYANNPGDAFTGCCGSNCCIKRERPTMKRAVLRWLSDTLHNLCYTFERWGRWVGRCQAPCPKCGELTAVMNRLCSTCYLEDLRRHK